MRLELHDITNFQEATYEQNVDNNKIIHRGLFTIDRITRDSLPEGFYLYELKSSNVIEKEPSQIADLVTVDFYGTVITSQPIDNLGNIECSEIPSTENDETLENCRYRSDFKIISSYPEVDFNTYCEATGFGTDSYGKIAYSVVFTTDAENNAYGIYDPISDNIINLCNGEIYSNISFAASSIKIKYIRRLEIILKYLYGKSEPENIS